MSHSAERHRWRSSKRITLAVASMSVASLFVVWGCRTAPVSGRRQLVLVSEPREIAMGVAAFADVKKKEPASRNQRYVEMVERVGRRIAAVSGRPDYRWEFHVIESEQPNAFCLPGGKVAFYEGILPICESEAGVAVVMSHEIAHALARHGSERMSNEYVATGAGYLINVLSQKREAAQREQIMKAYGLASKYGAILPYSRKHESEADAIGLQLMAKAGYDPSEAAQFWERFASMKQGPQSSDFFSTHPSDTRRAADLRKLQPAALEIYADAKVQYGLGEPVNGPGGESGTAIRHAGQQIPRR